ncbi:GIY-YIG nuclease family protein [Acinetobacter baumannii]|uniref:GIY-YIG nuclease family protein n=1 Tax=Acinetobacter baumannii TaxID=470 RepID=UPI00280D494D|nr:GIY-YIG nuclease family protein [Acinetobacter baumannii]MDQ8922865.1 GIY-YIG nuclease family protein [Acinetobacter baumannii]MDQ8926238.1 GIY-YIG nuclease family protein [Acinetobacter baumannii]MDQ8933188.1 GIY-YIG nuclease family protein [Acinetobacter baumannii]
MSDIKSLEDIFNDDDLGLLDDGKDGDIFKIKHVLVQRAAADEVAKRKRCKDFDQFEHLFKNVHRELREGKRKLLPFNDKGYQLVEGNYYVLNGLLAYLADNNFTSEAKTVDGKRFRKDGRTRTIFENGTESTMLYRSLAKALYKDGRIVSETNEQENSNFYTNFGGITEDDTSTGYIYILKSKSTDPRIQSYDHLYKIGFATTTVEKRIANAKKEPTYLMADVEVIAEYQAFNINPQKFEYYLHAFFGESCLDLLVADKDGKNHQPKEWFIAPIQVIQHAVELLVNGQIMNYQYNKFKKEIELR